MLRRSESAMRFLLGDRLVTPVDGRRSNAANHCPSLTRATNTADAGQPPIGRHEPKEPESVGYRVAGEPDISGPGATLRSLGSVPTHRPADGVAGDRWSRRESDSLDGRPERPTPWDVTVARPRLLNVPRQPDGHDRLHLADLSPNGSCQPRRSAPLGALDGSRREVWVGLRCWPADRDGDLPGDGGADRRPGVVCAAVPRPMTLVFPSPCRSRSLRGFCCARSRGEELQG